MFLLFAVLGAVAVPVLAAESDFHLHDSPAVRRDQKLFQFPPFFPSVTIAPEPCVTTDATYTNGVCYTKTNCANLKGTAAGKCAAGTGVCCYFIKTCGGAVHTDGTHFINPSYPGTDTVLSNCELTVNRINKNICQLRLDFESLILVQPDVNGACLADFMTVTGYANDANIPTLCGTNTGKHMYIDVSPTGGSLKINIDTSSTSLGRSWKIKVTQIACNSVYRAPQGCLQYYTQSSGVVESFNYVAPNPTEISSKTANQHLNNQHYGVCVASRDGYCSITWSPNPAVSPYAFLMTGDAVGTAPNLIGSPALIRSGGSCTTDYVVIPSGSYASAMSVTSSTDRFCGLSFPATVVSNVQPFVLYVVTDATEPVTEDTANTGFSLQYRQNACR